jgi:hypothetical protein
MPKQKEEVTFLSLRGAYRKGTVAYGNLQLVAP